MNNDIHEQIKEYYGVILQSSDDLKTNACCCSSVPPKYVKDILPLIKEEIKKRFYGCGSPIPMGMKGCKVLDLGAVQEEMSIFYLSWWEKKGMYTGWI